MLDGRYSAYDIESICSRYERIIGDARKSIENFENEEKKLKQELDGQYVKRDKLTQSLADNMVSLKQQKAGSDKYKKEYQTAITVLKHLSVPENRLFSDEPVYNMLIEKGYPKDKLVFDKYESGRHEPMYWRNIYPEFLQAMFEHKVEALECGVPIKYEDRTGFSSIPSVISIAPDDPGLSVKENFIYFDNSRTKWDKVFAYWWDAIPTNKISGGLYGDEWPGIEMERIEGTDIYRLVMPMGPSKIVFSSGVKDEDVQKGTIAYQTENMDYDDQENAGQIFRIDTSIEPRARGAYEKTKFKYSSGSWEDFEL